MLVHLHRSLIRPLNLHLDLHFHNFRFLYSIYLPDLIHWNIHFHIQCLLITYM